MRRADACWRIDFAEAIHNMMSRLESGLTTLPALAPLVAGYLVLALAAVYILRSSLRLPIVQYNRSISTSQVCAGAAPGEGRYHARAGLM